MNNCILSICIPTFNRLWKLKQQVDDLLSINDNRFNIIISDNESTDGTRDYLNTLINEKRVKVFYHEAVHSASNIASSLINADGKYALLLLDKDSIDSSHLVWFIDLLDNTRAKAGYCLLNNHHLYKNSFLYKTPSNLLDLAYLCRHPSGYFYDSKDLRIELNNSKELVDGQFPFTWDMAFTHMAAQNDTLIITAPLMTSETDQEGTIIKSLTYSVNNLWFSPQRVRERYFTFLKDLDSLGINKKEKRHIRNRLFRNCYYNSTVGYAIILSNDDLCEHYYIRKRDMSYKELSSQTRDTFRFLRNNGYSVWGILLKYFYARLRVDLYCLLRLYKKK